MWVLLVPVCVQSTAFDSEIQSSINIYLFVVANLDLAGSKKRINRQGVASPNFRCEGCDAGDGFRV